MTTIKDMKPWSKSSSISSLWLISILWFKTIAGVIIPPAWANHTMNPCAQESWQLLYWPEDGQCYNIFTQGPCEESQEIYFNEKLRLASCRCSRGTLWHSESNRCHLEYSKGPCNRREYLGVEKLATKNISEEGKPNGECRSYGECSPGQLYWPKTSKCYSDMSRGPCLHGHLLHNDPKTGSTSCGCKIGFMSSNYWPHGDSCHELSTRGPCVQGHIFLYNVTLGITECLCSPNMIRNYHQDTERCFELNKTGPCRLGQTFRYDIHMKKATCQCLDGYVEWQPEGQCYRAYTRGPCFPGHFLRPQKYFNNIGKCVRSSCNHGELYDPISDKCYSVGRRGPCPRGKLWVFERATSVQGSCHCDPHLIGYWQPHGVCYELGEKGPCPKRRVLTYERQTGHLKCRCDIRRGFMTWTSGRCIKAGVRRNKLIPVAGPIEVSERGNLIHTGRLHRGLTLPELDKNDDSHPIKRKPINISAKIQKDILEDILQTIRNVSFTQSRSSTSIRTQVSKQISPSVSVRIVPFEHFDQNDRSSLTTPPRLLSTPGLNNSKEDKVNSITFRQKSEKSPPLPSDPNNKVRMRSIPRRRRLGPKRKRVLNLTRKFLHTNRIPVSSTTTTTTSRTTPSSLPPAILDLPPSRRLRKRMMGRKDIPDLVMRRKRRRLK